VIVVYPRRGEDGMPSEPVPLHELPMAPRRRSIEEWREVFRPLGYPLSSGTPLCDVEPWVMSVPDSYWVMVGEWWDMACPPLDVRPENILRAADLDEWDRRVKRETSPDNDDEWSEESETYSPRMTVDDIILREDDEAA
jgi:hypothetical protein